MNGLFLRITPVDSMTLEDIKNIIEPLCKSYLISIEEASRVHFHIVMYTDRSVEDIRYQIKKKQGLQVYISGKQIEDKVKTIAYTIKDGNYIFKDIDAFALMRATQVTYKKLTFDKEIEAIKYWDDSSLFDDVLNLYQKYNKKIDKRHFINLLRTIKLKNSSDYREQFKKNILYEL